MSSDESEGVFTQQTRGIGADTGECELSVTGPDRLYAQDAKSVCLFEAPGGGGKESGRRRGPLLLSVFTDTTQIVPPQSAVGNIGGPLPSRLRGYGVWSENDSPGWGMSTFGKTVCGSLLLDMQVGAVRRTLIADLAPGTYQLPPCDSVMVTAGIRRISSAETVRVRVAASVTPGSMNQARPLIFTDGAAYGPDADGAAVLNREFVAPEGASSCYAFMQSFLGTYDVNMEPFIQFAMSYDVQDNVVPMEWCNVPPPERAVAVSFKYAGLTLGQVPWTWMGLRWRVDP